MTLWNFIRSRARCAALLHSSYVLVEFECHGEFCYIKLESVCSSICSHISRYLTELPVWSCRPHTNRTLANSTCYDGDFKSVFAGNTHIEKINRVNLLLSNDARQQRVKQPAKRYFILILMSLPERAEGGLVRKTRDVEN